MIRIYVSDFAGIAVTPMVLLGKCFDVILTEVLPAFPQSSQANVGIVPR
jgi:hypothetical protein